MTTVHLTICVCKGVVDAAASLPYVSQQWYRVKQGCCNSLTIKCSRRDCLIQKHHAVTGNGWYITNKGASMTTHHNNHSSVTSNESSSPQTSAPSALNIHSASPIGYQNLLQHSYGSHLQNYYFPRFRHDFPDPTVKPDLANHQQGQLPQPWL